MSEVVGVVHEILKLISEVLVEGRLEDEVVSHLGLELYLLTLCQDLDIALHEKLVLYFEFSHLLHLLFDFLFFLVHHMLGRLLFLQNLTLVFQVFFPNAVVVLERSSSAETLEVGVFFKDEVDVLSVVVCHVGDTACLLESSVLKIFDLFGLAHDDAVEQLMLIVSLVKFEVVTSFDDELLELLYLLPVFKGRIYDLPHLKGQALILKFVLSHGHALLVEAEESLYKLQEEEIVVADERRKPILGVKSGTAGVSLIGDFVSQVRNDLIKGPEMADVFAHQLLRGGVGLLSHQGVKCLFVIGDDLPGSTNAREHLREVLHPAVQIFILQTQFLVFPSVGLQFESHLSILPHQKTYLKLLVLHQLNNYSKRKSVRK